MTAVEHIKLLESDINHELDCIQFSLCFTITIDFT